MNVLEVKSLKKTLGKREIIQFSQQETRFEQMKKHQNELTQTHQKLIKHQSFQQILSDGLIILSIVVSILLIKNNVSKELLIPIMALSSSFGNWFPRRMMQLAIVCIFTCLNKSYLVIFLSHLLPNIELLTCIQ